MTDTVEQALSSTLERSDEFSAIAIVAIGVDGTLSRVDGVNSRTSAIEMLGNITLLQHDIARLVSKADEED